MLVLPIPQNLNYFHWFVMFCCSQHFLPFPDIDDNSVCVSTCVNSFSPSARN